MESYLQIKLQIYKLMRNKKRNLNKKISIVHYLSLLKDICPINRLIVSLCQRTKYTTR